MDPPEYRLAIDAAVDAFEAKRFEAALSAFERAHALSPSARTLRGIGLAHYSLSEHVSARRAFEAAVREPRKALDPAQRSELAGLIAECAQRTGRYTLAVLPEGARVELDGAAITDNPLILGLGAHVLVLSAPGYSERTLELMVAGKEDVTLSVELTRAAEPLAPPAVLVTPALPQPPPERTAAPVEALVPDEHAGVERGGRLWTWIALAAVPVFAGVATVTWLVGKAEHDEIGRTCDRQRCTESELQQRIDDGNLAAYETWTSVSLGAAALSLAGAGVLFVVEGERAGEGASLSLGAHGANVVLKARL